MKKLKIFLFTIIMASTLCFAMPAKANMAAPDDNSLVSTICFEKNNDLSVISEVLDIEIAGAMANIKATYNMKNNKNYDVFSDSMFISPNIEGIETKVLFGGEKLNYEAKSYALNNATKLEVEDWMLVPVNEYEDNAQFGKVDTISFNLNFKPNEEKCVEVSYTYRLGGYPTRTDHYKYGIIEYYLKPASMWNDFNDLTINLKLDEDMPVIKKSNLKFEKVGKLEQQYKSDKLPDDNLEIKLDQNGWQEFIGFFISPYFRINFLTIYLPILIVLLIVISIPITITVLLVKGRKKNNNIQFIMS